MGFILDKWKAIPIVLRRVILAVVGVVLITAAYGSYQVYSYTQNDPNFCRSCHTMESAWQRWRTSEHRNISCHNCHEQSVFESTEQIIRFALAQPERVSKHAGISDEACLKCHESGDRRWPQIKATAGHKVHFEQQHIACTKCHSISIHRFAPPTQICQVCHPDEQIKIMAMGQRYCLDCHRFLAEGSPLRPTRQTCLDCHLKQAQSKVHWPDNAPMRFTCSQCHKPHVFEEPVVNCLSCHQNIRQEGLHQGKGHVAAPCTTCHKPHEWEVTKREACLTCHANKAKHNPQLECNACHDFKK
jgi:nitrate/TMAO reductase-like tetraheme cytochrome c subunit